MLELVVDNIRSWFWRTVGAIQVAELLRHGVGGKASTELFGQVGIAGFMLELVGGIVGARCWNDVGINDGMGLTE